MSHVSISKAFAALLVVAAILVPAAGAQASGGVTAPLPAGINAGLGPGGGSAAAIPLAQPSATSPSDGFDWGDAAVGGLLVLAAGAAGFMVVRHNRESRAPLATS